MIEIVDNSNPYPALLGIEWATDMNEVINLKKHKMIFERKSLHIVVPLDLTEGERTLNQCMTMTVMKISIIFTR